MITFGRIGVTKNTTAVFTFPSLRREASPCILKIGCQILIESEEVVDRLVLGYKNRPKAGSLPNLSPQANSTASIASTGGTPATAFRSNNRQGKSNPYLCKEESSERESQRSKYYGTTKNS